MLDHTPKDRPSAAEAQRDYKGYVEFYKLLSDLNGERFDEMLFRLMIGNKPWMRSNRIARRNRFNRHRNVK